MSFLGIKAIVVQHFIGIGLIVFFWIQPQTGRQTNSNHFFYILFWITVSGHFHEYSLYYYSLQCFSWDQFHGVCWNFVEAETNFGGFSSEAYSGSTPDKSHNHQM